MQHSDSDDRTRSYLHLVKDVSVGHYRILEKIGAGGMGEVYLAEDVELHRRVALKFLAAHLCEDADCRARFKREAQAAARLNHPHIVTIHEVGEFNGRPFFAMEQVEGQSLREYARGRDLPVQHIVELGVQVCEGLAAAHEAGIIHRDIKPSNILVDSHGRVRILDFGLATVKGSDPLTRTGSTLGTLGYMSPEQVRGESVDSRADLFSLGVVLYELITGKSPFAGESEAATLKNVLDREPEPLVRYKSGVPDELQRIVGKLLSKDRDLRYQHADELSADLKRLTSQAAIPAVAQKRRLRVLLPSLALLGLLILALALKPWRLEVSPTHESQAATDWLAVMYFDNIADPGDSKRLGEIATNLLITGLSQSQYIRVMSSQRLYDLLKQVGKESLKTIDRATASEIARKAGARWMLTGSILQSEPTIVLTAQLIEVSSGGVLASQRATGEQGENIFAVIDRLTEDVRKCNMLPATMRSEPPVAVADVTTHSPEAYRYYLEGREFVDKGYRPQARERFLKAIALDSTFAMAYLGLMGTSEKDAAHSLEMAERYADRSSDRERRIIHIMGAVSTGFLGSQLVVQMREYLGRYSDDKWAWATFGASLWDFVADFDSALAYQNRALELDSTYKLPYNYLTYIYAHRGQYEQAFAANNRYIDLAPDEANPYDTRGDLFAWTGQLDSAIAWYERALAIRPDFAVSIEKLGCMYMYSGQVQRAESLYKAKITAFGLPEKNTARGWFGYVLGFQGRFKENLQLQDDCIAANRLDAMEDANAGFYSTKAGSYGYLEMWDSAAANARACEALTRDTLWANVWFLSTYYRVGDTAGVTRLMRRLSLLPASGNGTLVALYWAITGDLALTKKEYPRAIECLSHDGLVSSWDIVMDEPLAEAYLESGDPRKAIITLERLQKNYYRLKVCGSYVTSRYVLGKAYEAAGETAKAQAAYEQFLALWKNADPGLKDVEDAKARLARLKAKSQG